MSTIKCLLAVELFELSSNYINQIRERHRSNDEVFELLPDFTLRGDNHIITAEYYLQFVGLDKVEAPEKYLMFGLHTLDHQLDYEISQTGAEDLFKDLDFKKILSYFTPQTDDDMSRFAFPETRYLIVELTYTSYYDNYSGATEGDMEVDITGYLNKNLEPIYFNNN